MLRIKRVVIQGFKTFARRTEFVFDAGVTAIVGPNGSGKSNIADAILWCLGEQSFSLLRSRKTADVIFAGSDKRARLGMASVSLVLDNSAGELPVDFTEVEITRRAYRDGENEYLLNGKRVRLQDITQLLAPSGLGKRAYAVIGQGLIDRVLSLKPEERRSLFEEAAGITGYQSQRNTALRRLEATQQNLARVQDILAELTPRLRRLKHQAERARERAQVEADLRELLRIWYGYRWHHTLAQLAEHRRAAQELERQVAAQRAELDTHRERIEALRQEQATLRERLAQLHQRSSQHHREAEQLGRTLAVSQERRHHLQARQEELRRELDEMQVQQEIRQARLERLRQEIEQAQAEHTARSQAVAQLQAALEARQAQRAQQTAQLQAAQRRQRMLEERLAQLRSRLDQLHEQRAQLAQAIQECEQERVQAQEEMAQAQSRLDGLERAYRRAQEAATTLEQKLHRLDQALAQHRQALEQAERARREADRQVDRLQTRLDLLQRLQDEGAGYASGVRAVLQAAGQGRLRGILGTVASQVHVPATLEQAIQTALGGAFQHVVVERWEQARAAIEFLHRNRRGRATFLPLDRLHVPRPIPAPAGPGVLGNAAELVDHAPAVEPVVRQLLGRVWVVEDLDVARQVLDRHRGSRPTVVTLRGEIVRPGGAVSGGRDSREGGTSVLARERELRELPEQVAQAQEQAQAAAQGCHRQAAALEETQQAMARLRQELQELREELEHLRQARENARLARAQAQQRVTWQQAQQARLRSQQASLEAQEKELEERWGQTEQELAQARHQVTQVAAAVQEAQSDALLRELADRRAEAAEARGRLDSLRALHESQERTLAQTMEAIERRQARLEQLQAELQELDQRIQRDQAAEARLTQAIAALDAAIQPLEAELGRLAQAQEQAEARERRLQAHLRHQEESWRNAQLQLQRTEDRLEALQREIRHDFGLAELEQTEDLTYQPPLPLDSLVASFPVVQELPPGLEEEVQATRARLRRLGPVNPDAPREYEEVAQRHTFLQAQVEDLEAASADLHQVIRELDQRMEQALRETFRAVAREFTHYFQVLFQGGTARLELTEPNEILHSGVEIVVRPPGKRLQNLDLLSGGERSLTASALIFAILRVSPTPFCILDEVDAALDEANVDRLRTVLEELGARTQFILITHNRRTLEAADAIYGVTMGDDGVSQVISLRLEDPEVAQLADGPGARTEAVPL